MLNHVLLHQTVIGQETIAQMEMAGEKPDVVIACVGGGSNFGGLVFPWLRRNLRDGETTRFVAAEPAACPTLTKGVYAYDFGDTAGLTPLMPMYTLGHDFVPPPVHAGGLRYHGDSPLLCALVHEGLIEARAYRQTETFEAGVRFARSEGIIPAPEPTHAIRAVIEEAEAAKQAGEERVILFGLCGHGHFDLSAYDAYLAGTLEDPGVLPGGHGSRDRTTCRRASRRSETLPPCPSPPAPPAAISRSAPSSPHRRDLRPVLGPLVLSAIIVFLPVALIAAIFAGSAARRLLVLVVSIVASFWYTGVVVQPRAGRAGRPAGRLASASSSAR